MLRVQAPEPSMDTPRLQRLSVTMGAVRELLVQEMRASGAGPAGPGRALSMALELLEVLWAELRQMTEEQERLRRALGPAGARRPGR